MYPQLLHKDINSYSEHLSDSDISHLFELAKKLKKIKICHINSTAHGGGVAEMLQSEVPLLRSLGLSADWQVISGTQKFFSVTKKMHNALQGEDIHLTSHEKGIYRSRIETNIEQLNLDYDVIIVHDAQPVAIPFYAGKQNAKWIWRCHVDTTSPEKQVWKYLNRFISKYDATIFSSESFVGAKKAAIIYPAIDILTLKNKRLSREACKAIVRDLGVSRQYLLVCVSRFDKWKGLDRCIAIAKELQKEFDVGLVIVGSFADDDPEGLEQYKQLRQFIDGQEGLYLFSSFGKNDLEVNVFQTAADVVLQLSTREGFGLTVSEAWWKRTPVIGSRIGGMSIQMPNEFFCVKNEEEAVSKIAALLSYHGENVPRDYTEHTKKFLMPRMMKEELELICQVLSI